MPQFTSSFNVKSLGLVPTSGNILLPKEKVHIKAAPKKKRGRPIGLKNKKPKKKPQAVDYAVELIFGALPTPPSPSTEGKEKV